MDAGREGVREGGREGGREREREGRRDVSYMYMIAASAYINICHMHTHANLHPYLCKL